MLRHHIIHSDSREIKLRTGNRNQYINKIIDKKRSDQHKRNLFKPLKTKQEIINSHNPNHWIISKIPHIKWFTEPHGRKMFTKFYRRLATEQKLLRRSEEIIQIGKRRLNSKVSGYQYAKNAICTAIRINAVSLHGYLRYKYINANVMATMPARSESIITG